MDPFPCAGVSSELRLMTHPNPHPLLQDLLVALAEDKFGVELPQKTVQALEAQWASLVPMLSDSRYSLPVLSLRIAKSCSGVPDRAHCDKAFGVHSV